MDPASYISASGMKAQLQALNIASNNLANSNSPGFKVDNPFFRMLNQSYGNLSGAAVAGTVTDYTAGAFKSTGNPLDLAINGDGFFTLRTPSGIGYTRNGSFSISPAGELVTQDGFQVMDDRGQPIAIAINPQSANMIDVNPNGDIYIDDLAVGKLGIYRFGDMNAVEKLNDQIFVTDQQPEQVVTPDIQQGFTEQSNTNAISSMLELVEIQRAYEMNSKSVMGLMTDINRRAISGILTGQ